MAVTQEVSRSVSSCWSRDRAGTLLSKVRRVFAVAGFVGASVGLTLVWGLTTPRLLCLGVE